MAVFNPKLICRLCAKEKEFCVDVFGEDGVKNNLSKKIRLCLPITVREDDEYPKQICLNCLNKLDTSYELYSGCLSAEHTIKRLMKYCSTHVEPSVDMSPVEVPVEDIKICTDRRAQQEPQPVLSWRNPIIKIGETVVTLIDKTRKRKCNEHALKPRPKIRSVQNDQYDNLNIKLDSDDSNTVGSPLQSSVLGNGGGDDDDECSLVPQQGSQLHLPPENLSSYTVAPSSQTCLAGNVSTAPSSQQLWTSGKVSTTPSGGQRLGSIPTSRKTKCSGAVQSASDVGNQPSTSNVVMTSSELSGTSSQYKNFSSLSDSAGTVRVHHPSSNAVRQPQVYIPGSVYNLLTDQQECSISGSLTVVNALEDTVVPSSHARIPGNVRTAHLFQQLGTSGKVSEAPSGGQLVGSIPTSRENKYLGTVQTSSIVGNKTESNSSASNVVMTSSELSGTSNRDNFSSLLGSAVTVMVQQPASDKGRQPQFYIPDSVYNASIRQEDSLPSGSLMLVNALENTVAPSNDTNIPGNVSKAHSVEASCHQLYLPNGAQGSFSLGGNQQAVVLECQHLYSSGNPVQDQGVSSDTAIAITSPVITAICPTSAVAGAKVATVPTTAGAVSLGATTTVTSCIPNVVLVNAGACAAYPAGTATVIDMKSSDVTEIGSGPPISASTTSLVTSRPSSNIAVVTPRMTSNKSAAISDTDSTNQTGGPSTVLTVQEQVSEESSSITGVRPSTTTSSVTTASTSSSVRTVAATGTGSNNRGTQEINRECPYCRKTFRESIYLLHIRLHYRKRFYTCLSCGKNFRTVLGLENHRCTRTAE